MQRTAAASPRIVIGIGLNVNNSFAQAPTELRRLATSLRDATGQTYRLTDVLLDVVRHTFDQLVTLARHPDQLADQWQSRSVLTGRTITVDLGTQQRRGTCLGIDHDGALLLLQGDSTARILGGVIASID